MFSFEILLEHLKSSDSKVVMWATHQLIEHWANRAPEFVELLLHSEIDGVRQAGILFAGKCDLKEHSFRIFGWFSRSEGELKEACATALAGMKHASAREIFWKECLKLLDSEELNAEELRTSLGHILVYSEDQDWWNMEQLLPSLYGDHMKSLQIFEALCDSVSSSEQVQSLLTHYAVYREFFSDPLFSQCFMGIVYRESIHAFLEKRLLQEVSFKDLYSEAFLYLGLKKTPAMKKLLLRIDTLHGLPTTRLSDYAKVHVSLLEELESQVDLEQDAEDSLEMTLLKQFVSFEEDACIHRMQELEELLVFWLPLSYILRRTEQDLLQDPLYNASEIATLYFSDFPHTELMFDLMELLQTLKTPHQTQFFQKALQTHLSPSVAAITPQASVWFLMEGRSFAANYPFFNLLPEPWNYDLPHVFSLLILHYKKNFAFLLENQCKEAVDYAMDLFQRQADESVVTLVLEHFTALINFHFTACFEFIELNADTRFIPKLEAHYHKGESFIAQLLSLLYILHEQQPMSCLCVDCDSTENLSKGTPQVRIQCPQCQVAYHYPIQELYYNEQCIQERRPFLDQDLWNPETLSCKCCKKDIPFQTDSKFRSNLYTEALTAALMTLSEEEKKRMSLFKAISFPVFLGERKTPGEFFSLAQQQLQSGEMTLKLRAELLLNVGKLRLALNEMDLAQEVFQECLKQTHHLEALFHLGGIAFLKKNIYEARLYFSRFMETLNLESCTEEEKNMHELSMQYLEVLEHREFRRSSFTLIQ